MASHFCEPDTAVKEIQSQAAEVELKDGSIEDTERAQTAVVAPSSPTENEPFGDETNAEIKYRTMHWWQAGIIMVAETISIGILSLPAALAAVGLVP